MASSVSEEPVNLAVPEWGDSDAVDEKVDRYLAARLRAVGADYKSVALTTFLLAAGVGVVSWLAVGVLADHWIVPGGLGRSARLAWLVVGAAAVAAAFARWVVPLVMYRVNLVYAARTIERANPGLHNDVVNTVLARAQPQRSTPVVLASLEHRAAKRLSKLPADVVADRSTAVRLAAVLAGLVALACVYAVVSPKSLAVSLARLGAPLARIQPPTRVQLDEPRLSWRPAGGDAARVAPRPLAVVGNSARMVRNRQLVVSSRIRGLDKEERAAVEATAIADDGSPERASTWSVGMERSADGSFEARLPSDGRGLVHSVDVVIVAGDARTEPVRVTVVDEPSLLVRQLLLSYPAYTRREPQTLEWQGDVSGPEGTRVTLHAESNGPLETASIDFGCDGRSLVKLRIDPKDLARATGSFELRMASDGSGPWERDYQLAFTPRSASAASDVRLAGIAHRIEVIADKLPEVRIVSPEREVMRVPPGEPVVVAVEAIDPDYGLRSVKVEVELERAGERLPRPAVPVLDRELRAAFSGRGSVTPSAFGAAAGDRLHYRAVAADVRSPSPNVAHTKWFTLEIDPSAPPAKAPPAARLPDEDAGAGEDGGEGESRNGGSDDGRGERGDAADGRDSGGGSSGGSESEGGSSESGESNERNGSSGDADAGRSGAAGQQEADRGQGKAGSGPPEQANDGERSQGGGKTPGSSSPSKSGDAGDGGDATEGPGPASNEGGRPEGDGTGRDGSNGGSRQGGSPEQGGERDAAGAKQRGADGRQDGSPESGQGAGKGGGGDRDQRQPARPGDRNGGAEGGKESSRPVASDGTNDGEAIERILEQRQREQGGGEQGGGKQRGGEQRGGEQGEGRQDGERSGGDRQQQGDRESAGGEDGRQGGPKPEGECRPEQGKPCGGTDCPTCRGGGSKDGAAGSGSGGGSREGGAPQPSNSSPDGSPGEGDRKPGKGEAGGGEPAASGQPVADRAGTQAGRGQTDSPDGKPGGSRAPGSEGSGSEGAASEGAANEEGGPPKNSGKAGGSKPGGGQEGGGRPGEGQAGGDRPGDADGGTPGEDLANDDPASDRKPSEQPGAGGRAGRGLGGRDAGEGSSAPDGGPPSKDAEWGGQDLSHARNSVDLAVEHLRRSVEEGRTDVIDSLGWTREQARAFLDRWARMAREAKEGGPNKQQEFDRAVRSLGLPPAGVSRRREPDADERGGQAEGRRSRPPSEYREQFEAFTRGAGNR